MTSSVIQSIGYDADARVLEVELLTGHVYRYVEVAPFFYEGLLAAKSKGTFFNRKIARRFKFEQLK